MYLLLLLLMIVHGPIAVNNYWALMIFITMSSTFIVIIAISNVVNDDDKFKKLVTVWLAVHLFLAIIGIIHKGVGIGGFLGDENDFCMTLNMIIPFSFSSPFPNPERNGSITSSSPACSFSWYS